MAFGLDAPTEGPVHRLGQALRVAASHVVQTRCPSDFARFTWAIAPHGGPEPFVLSWSPEAIAQAGADAGLWGRAMAQGVQAAAVARFGGPLVGLHLRVVDLQAHALDSREASFVRAAAEAYLQAAAQAIPLPPEAPPHLPSTQAEWRALVAAFDAGELPWAHWRHPQHLAVGLWGLRFDGFEATQASLPGRIRAFNAAHGVATTPTRGYHDTLTQAWLHLAEAARQATPASAGPLVQLQAVVQALGDPRLPWRFHSAAQLASPEARAQAQPPDLAPYSAWASPV